MGNGSENTHWYQTSLGSGILGGVATTAIIGIGSVLINFATTGGLVRALGGITTESLPIELRATLDSNPSLKTDLAGKAGPEGQQGPKGDKGDAGEPGATVEQIIAELEANHWNDLKGQQGDNGMASKGIIVASIKQCDDLEPNGNWRSFTEATGRFIIGAGKAWHHAYRQWDRTLPDGAAVREALTGYEALALGGEEKHTLTKSELPPHAHVIDDIGSRDDKGTNIQADRLAPGVEDGASRGLIRTIAQGFTHESGGDNGEVKSHNNMPPYIALYFCEYEGSNEQHVAR